jgi:diguanylate cyclase (GGDEF)-like protein
MYWPSLRRITIPLVLFVLALFLRGYSEKMPTAYVGLVLQLPFVLLFIVSALCIYYNRSRLFVSCLTLGLIFYLIQTQLQSTLNDPSTLMVYSLITLLHPLSLLFFLLVPERGLKNRYGLILNLSVLGTFIVSVILFHYFDEELVVFIGDWLQVKPFNGYVLSITASTCYLFVFTFALFRLIKRNDDFAVITVSITLFTFTVLAFLDMPNISSVLFSVCALSLIISMLGTSYAMAYRDDLTGLLGRRALNDRMKGLGRQYVMAMMDVDHFKRFNDTHGHDIGDEVLKMVAKQIGLVKGGGTAYRYGGEEFCVIYTNKDLQYCLPFLEVVSANIENYSLVVRDETQRPKTKSEAKQRRGSKTSRKKPNTVSVTISIGLAASKDRSTRPEDVLKSADVALYKAKKEGRNRIEF